MTILHNCGGILNNWIQIMLQSGLFFLCYFEYIVWEGCKDFHSCNLAHCQPNKETRLSSLSVTQWILDRNRDSITICRDMCWYGSCPSLTAIRRLFNTSISTFTPWYTRVFAQIMAVTMAPKYQLVQFEFGQCFNSSNFCC